MKIILIITFLFLVTGCSSTAKKHDTKLKPHQEMIIHKMNRMIILRSLYIEMINLKLIKTSERNNTAILEEENGTNSTR